MPQVENGLLHYALMEIAAASETDSGWVVKNFATRALPVASGPNAVTIGAIDGYESQRAMKSGLRYE